MDDLGDPTPSQARSATEDLALVRGVLDRDVEALDRFAERARFVPRLLSAIQARRGRVFTPSELEDLAQDCLVAIWRKLREYDGRVALEGWFHRFCVLEYLRRARDRRVRQSVLENDPQPIEEYGGPPGPAFHEHEDLRLALERLDEEDRALIDAKHFGQQTFEELAGSLGQNCNTVKTRYYRILSQLRAWLGQTHAPERGRDIR